MRALRCGRASLLLASTLALSFSASTSSAFADNVDTEIGQDIATLVSDVFGDGSNVAVQTSIASVRYEDPEPVGSGDRAYFEVRGSIQGTGWGGVAGAGEDAFAHYAYDIPFVLRWRRHFDGTLVCYYHGFTSLDDAVFFDSILGPLNETRHAESEGGFVSDAVLSRERRHAFFAANLGGLGRDGEFTAHALEGPFAGAPLNLTLDAATVRDITQLAGRLLEKLSDRSLKRTFGTGHSAGAFVTQFIAGGVSTALFGPPRRVFTGGDFRTAYDPASGLVLDGVIPLAGTDVLVNPEFPLAVPMILIGGNADFAGLDSVSYAGRLLAAGVDLDERVRIYQVANLTHAFAEIVESAPNIGRVIEEQFGVPSGSDGDRMQPVVAAAIDALEAWVRFHDRPPKSRIAGRPVDTDGDGAADELRFEQTGGGETTLLPFPQDPAIDTYLGFQINLTSADGFPNLIARYASVLGAHEHKARALELPYQDCRLGGFELRGTTILLPFPDLADRWPKLKTYKQCLFGRIDELADKGLYDRKIGRDVVLTDAIRELFDN